MGAVDEGGIKLMDYLFTDGSIGRNIGNKTPVAIAVAPASHFADGKWRFMSLKSMSASSTSGSTTNETMAGGQNAKSYLPTKYGDGAVTINEDGTYKGVVWRANLPSDKSGFTTEYAGLKYKGANSGNHCPSPFLSNGEKNNVYYTSGSQCLYDTDGVGNTTALKEFPACVAAIACATFAPGIYDGQWYLPAMGELGYVMVQWSRIQAAISNAVTTVPGCGCELSTTTDTNQNAQGNQLWSSTETSNNAFATIILADGRVHNAYKGSTHFVRAFVKIQEVI